MEGTGRQRIRVIAMRLALIAIATSWLAAFTTPQALAQASGQGQAYTRLRSVVSRVVFQYVIGSAIDLPLTLHACDTPEARDAAYDIVTRIIAGEEIDRTTQKALCHPHYGRSQRNSRDAGSLTFDLPSKYCAAIKDSVEMILRDETEKSYTELLDMSRQRQIRRVFSVIALYGTSHVFPNTSDTGYSKHFVFTPQDCVAEGERARLVILLQRRPK